MLRTSRSKELNRRLTGSAAAGSPDRAKCRTGRLPSLKDLARLNPLLPQLLTGG